MRYMKKLPLWALVATLGCGDESQSGNQDGGPPDAEVEPGYCPELGLPVATVTEAEPLVINAWRAAISTGSDAVLPKLRDGTFTYPEEDVHEGLNWGNAVPDDNGSLGSYFAQVVYLVARATFDEPTRLVMQTDRTLDVFLNGVAQPGDIYGSGRMRVPMLAEAGENIIVVRGVGFRGDVRVNMWTTPDELYMNLADLTAPDLVEGDDAELYLGVPVLNLMRQAATCVRATVVESDQFEATSLLQTALPAGSVTQLAFHLVPKTAYPAFEPEATIPVTVRVEAESLEQAYEVEIELPSVEAGPAYRRTFRSPVDGSVQYYGVLPPTDYDPAQSYSLILSLHGAGVQGIGQARSYSAKDWAFVVAPTNRRPFGFDWEEWGRLNAINALEDAMAHFSIDPTRVYLTGHSMGGHGTWHVGVMHPGRFAVIGPSAGWESFYSYGGSPRPTGPFARARAHSDTLVYLSNLARRGVYILHGDADDNVPWSEGQNMLAAAQAVPIPDLDFHWEPGAGHWWNGDASEGVDCVDWPPMMDMMQARQLDPVELDFDFRSPSPAYSPTHSFVTLDSATTPYEDLVVSSQRSGSTVTVTTTNVRSMQLDGEALGQAGITDVVVDGDSYPVTDDPILIGPQTGKNRTVYGTYNQVFHRPHCYIYPEDDDAYAHYAAYLTSYWAIIGNGQACAMSLAQVTPEVREAHNLIYLGLDAADIGSPDVPFEWDDEAVTFRDIDRNAGLMFVFPDGERLGALLATPAGSESFLYSIVPFSSRSGLPDYLIWAEGGSFAGGFFDADWQYDPALGFP